MPGDIFGLRTNSSKIYDKQVEGNWPESANYGYFCGGYSPPYSDLIDRIDFSNETMSLPGNDLTEARYGMGVVSNSNYGYFGAGNGPGAVVTVDKIDFSNDTISPSTNNLPTAKDKLAAVSG